VTAFEESLGILDTPELEFRAGKRALDPVQGFALNNYKPFSTPSLEENVKVDLMVPLNYQKTNKVKEILQDLKNGWALTRYPRSRYHAFKDTYDIDLDFSSPKKYESASDVKREINHVARLRDKRLRVLVIVSSQRSEIGGFYYQVKTHSIPKQVQTQILLDSTVEKYFEPDYQRGDLLWNFSLSIFSKVGGIPWKLANRLEKVSAFVSLTTVASTMPVGIIRRKGVASVEVVNCWGEHLGRVFMDAKIEEDPVERGAWTIDQDTIKSLVEGALDNVERGAAELNKAKKEDYIVFHTTDRYVPQVYDLIKSIVSSRGFQKFKILHIQARGPLSIYNPEASSPRRAWPKEGSYWYLENGRIAFLYTMGRWPYSTILGTEPYVISPHSVSPLQVNFVTGSEGTKLEDSDLEHIYNLTRLHYYSADIPRIRMPLTTRIGRRAALLAASGLTMQDFDISYLY